MEAFAIALPILLGVILPIVAVVFTLTLLSRMAKATERIARSTEAAMHLLVQRLPADERSRTATETVSSAS